MHLRLRESSRGRLRGDDNFHKSASTAPAKTRGILGMMRHRFLGVVRLQATALVAVFCAGCVAPALVTGIDPKGVVQLAAEELPLASEAGSSVTGRSALMAARPIAVADPQELGEQSVVVKSSPDDR